MVNGLLQVVLLLIMPPLLLGVIVKTKALFAGRRGAPLLQPYYDLARLFRKSTVTSRTTSWVFAAGPVAGLVTVALAGLMVPLNGVAAPVAFAGDLVLLAYLLGLGRFFTTAAALDTGSAFEGMGSARELSFACLAEPALFLALLTLARLTGTLSLSGMLDGALAASWPQAGPSLVLVIASLFVVLLAENSRIPFDDPNTHLELTMIHEVMVLDHSGPALGLVLYGASMKLFVLGAIVVRAAGPLAGGHAWLGWLTLILGLLLLAVAIGVVESIMARLRLAHVPNLLVAAGLLSGLGLLLAVKWPW